MPIEIKEISIKADIYPGGRNGDEARDQVFTQQELERLKKEITREVTQAVLQKIQQTTER
jgi:hypothetical protein